MKEKHPKGTPGHGAQDYRRSPKECPRLSYYCGILEGQTQAALSLLFWDFSGGTLSSPMYAHCLMELARRGTHR